MFGGVVEFLGLGERATKIYQEMLRRPGVGVEKLAAELGWDLDQVRSALDELAEQRLIRPSWDSAGVFQPVSPQVGLSALIARREADLTRLQSDLTANKVFAAQLSEDFARFARAEGGDVERLDGIDAIRTRIEQLSHDCRDEVLTLAPDGAQTRANREAGRPLNRMLLDRGTTLRTIYLDSIRNDRGSVEYAQWLTDQGAEIRTLATVPSRMLIFDRRIAVVPVDAEASGSGALVVVGSAIVVAMCRLFDLLWEQALPLASGPLRPKPDEELSSQGRAILHLLAEGHTDETVARRLGISVRTSRRITADLMARANARSRFELAVQATQRGWMAAGPPR